MLSEWQVKMHEWNKPEREMDHMNQEPLDFAAALALLRKAREEIKRLRPEETAMAWRPISESPDLDGRLWPICVRTQIAFKMDYEYYHFIEGWATDEDIVAWLPVPIPSMDKLPPLPQPQGKPE